jgi:hemolysin activation/secretion protein
MSLCEIVAIKGQDVPGDRRAPLHQAGKNLNRRIFPVFVLLFPIAAPALAQIPPAPPSLQVSPIPRLEPPEMPSVGPGLQGLPAGPLINTAPEQPVAVRGVTVEGVTVYPPAGTDALVAGLVGPAVPLKQIEAGRLALVRTYRTGGYPLVSVQATRSADGMLHFVVFEGRIAEVRLEGDIGPAGTQVLRFLRRLTESRPIDAASLERWLLLAQDVPGIALHAVLRPSDTEPGALTLVAIVQRTPVSALLTADNRAYRRSGPEQALAVFDLNSVTSLGERTEISLFRTFNDTQIFGQASTELFAGASGLRVRLYAGAGNSAPSGFLRAEGYDGNTTVAGLQVSYPLIRARQQTLMLTGNADALDSVITTAPQAGGVTVPRAVASKDSLRVLRGGADYALQDLLAGDTRPAVNGVSVHLSQGVPGLGATTDTATPARIGAAADFLKAAAEISRNQTVFAPWSGAAVSVLGLAAGQVSGAVLPPAEKFFLGGNRYTRGFYSGEASGDNALALTAELQLTTGTGLTVHGQQIDIGTQYYLFYDYGQTWQNQRTDPNNVLKSYGLGVRVSLTQTIEIDLEGVRRASLHPDGAGASRLKADDIYWRALARF